MIEQAKSRLDDLTAGFTSGQKMLMGVVFATVVGGLYLFSTWASTTDYAPLYTDLETGDAASIVDELSTMGIDYQLADQGRTVMVPRDQVYELRLDLSSAGLPDGGSQGYSLLDDQGITSTQFQQRVAFQRALEGELAATIRSIDAIESANVHLVIPRDDLFVGDDIESTASVLVHTAATISPEQVQAIVNLVAGSVEGLRADAVTVADQNGFVLAAPGQTPFERAGSGTATNETRAYEESVAADIQNMLTAVVGPGNVVVTVSADMDWDASSTVKETRTPSGVGDGETPLPLRTTNREETYTSDSSDPGDGGTLGGDADPADTATTSSNYDLSDSSTEYIYDSEVTTSESSGGTVERLNVAVLLNEAESTDAQLAEIETLVTSAAGIDTARGDTLAVSRLAFDETITQALAFTSEDADGATAAAAGGSDGMIRTAVLAGLGLLIVVMAAVQFWRGRRDKEEVEELDLLTLTNSLTAGAARPNLAGAASGGANGASSTISRPTAPPIDDSVSPTDELRMLVDQQPDEVARLLRTWLADRRAVAR